MELLTCHVKGQYLGDHAGPDYTDNAYSFLQSGPRSQSEHESDTYRAPNRKTPYIIIFLPLDVCNFQRHGMGDTKTKTSPMILVTALAIKNA